MPTAAARFHAKYVVSEDGCWEWTASRNIWGYGEFVSGGKLRRAHRFAYELLVGPIPEGHQLDHLCRNRGCVNPAHLEPVTPRANTLRSTIAPAALNASKTHCRWGHEFTPENTYVHPGRAVRDCMTCRREAKRRYRARCST